MTLGRCRTVIALIPLLLVCGCPSIWNTTAEEPEKVTAQQLFDDAEKLFMDKDYVRAIDLYERLRSAHPNFEKIREVHLRIGDSYYRDGEYDKASAEYLRFASLFPDDSNVPRAKYMVGMCYFDQIKRVDLDDLVVRRAAEVFKTLADQEKDSEWGKKAQEKLLECRKKLAAKELYKANTYMSTKRYKAARIAAQRILDKYSELGFDDDAKEIIEKVRER